MLPAERGDCLWVTYGTDAEEHHLLIDGGPSETIKTLVPELERRIRALPGERDRVELAVETHIDADHIQGLVSLLADPGRVPLFRDVWLNGYRHVVPEALGARDAEMLTASLLQHLDRWNAAFDGAGVAVPDRGPLPVVELAGGMKLTLLTPSQKRLHALAPEWEKSVGALAGKGMKPPKGWVSQEALGSFDPDAWASAPYSEDRSKPNRAGIAFVAEYDGRRVLFLADVPARDVVAGLDRLGPGVQEFDAVKLAHHGSRNNTSPELCARVTCKRWLVSSNGARFGHPDYETLARVIVSQRRPTLYFNYATDKVRDVAAGAGERYRAVLPKAGAEGLAVDL